MLIKFIMTQAAEEGYLKISDFLIKHKKHNYMLLLYSGGASGWTWSCLFFLLLMLRGKGGNFHLFEGICSILCDIFIKIASLNHFRDRVSLETTF